MYNIYKICVLKFRYHEKCIVWGLNSDHRKTKQKTNGDYMSKVFFFKYD